MKKKFVPILGDLEKLTEEERQKYVLDVCEFLSVPPEIGAVNLRLHDSGDGKRHLMICIDRGATDIIRKNMGIDVDSMEPVNGDGYVGWLVKGHDKTGRHEMAIGTVSTLGLKGQQHANCVMAAQTKACRRMTLQFVGGGFSDITEFHEKTTNIASSSTPLSNIAAQPSVFVNNEAGKEVKAEPPEETGGKEVTAAPAASVSETVPTEEQKKEFGRQIKDRYINNNEFIAAGFQQSEKLGSRLDQMKAFVKKMYPGKTTQTLSVEQWESLIMFLDMNKAIKGFPWLVQHIYEQIDPKKETANA
jgi:hypothetical protein